MDSVKLRGEFTAQVSKDFCSRLAELMALYEPKFDDNTRRQYHLFETAAATMPETVFAEVRDIILRLEGAIVARDIPRMSAQIKLEPEFVKRGRESVDILNAALKLWALASKRDVKKSFALADLLLHDCQEWQTFQCA
jgi:hypothetical protein